MTPKEAFKEYKKLAKEFKDGEWEYHSAYIELGKELLEIAPIIEHALTELEELKKRNTPMKLTQSSRFTSDKKLYGMYACNSCHEVIPYITLNSKRVKPKFCYHCGQRLDWSDEK